MCLACWAVAVSRAQLRLDEVQHRSFMKAKHMKTDSGTCNPSGPGQPRSEGVDEGVAEYLV